MAITRALICFVLLNQACKPVKDKKSEPLDTQRYHALTDSGCLAVKLNSPELSPEENKKYINLLVSTKTNDITGYGACPKSMKLSTGEEVTEIKQCLPLKGSYKEKLEDGRMITMNGETTVTFYSKWAGKDKVVKPIPSDKAAEYCDEFKSFMNSKGFSLTTEGYNLPKIHANFFSQLNEGQ